VPYRQLPWEIIDEMTLRHPGYVAYVVPYEGIGHHKATLDLYQGEIVITGEPAIKPYDQVFLFDTYNDMAGAVEVEQVTHIFSQETGFVCRIWTGRALGLMA
jgi:hypothetical protein